MKLYRTTGALTINSGEIKLSEKQAWSRKHLLSQAGDDGVYVIKGDLQFKVGEVVGLPVINKAQLMVLEPLEALEDEQKRKPGRPKN